MRAIHVLIQARGLPTGDHIDHRSTTSGRVAQVETGIKLDWSAPVDPVFLASLAGVCAGDTLIREQNLKVGVCP